MLSTKPVAVIALVACAACVAEPVYLARAAQTIAVVRFAHHREGMMSLGRVHCAVHYPGYGHDANAIACEYQLMNQAAELGGTMIVVDDMQVSFDGATMDAEVYRHWPAAGSR